MASKKSFAFYESFLDAIDVLDDADQLELYKAVCYYALRGETIELKENWKKGIFLSFKGNLDVSAERYRKSIENGKKGGAPKGNENAKKTTQDNLKVDLKQPTKNQNNLNDNVNDKDNDNDNVNEKKKDNANDNGLGCLPQQNNSISLSTLLNFISYGGYNVDGEKFYNYYTERNWKDKNGKAVDWQNAVKMWHSNELKKQTTYVSGYAGIKELGED